MSRKEIAEDQLIKRGISDPRVLQAMRKVDRTLFIPNAMKEFAYEDRPLNIGKGQTIAQPFMVAYMAQELKLNPDDIILEIGTGCGYHAAVLAHIVKHVYSIEVIEWLEE